MKRSMCWYLTGALVVSGAAYAADPGAPTTPASPPMSAAPAAPALPPAELATSPQLVAARGVAEDWLRLIDNGQYAQSWNATSTVFRSHEPQADWIKAIGSLRKPTGRVLNRTYEDGKVSENLPGAPPGQFASVRFVTTFSSAPAALETVTTVLENGQWRVTGYSVDDAPGH